MIPARLNIVDVLPNVVPLNDILIIQMKSQGEKQINMITISLNDKTFSFPRQKVSA